jgi:hypothetical protein
MNLSVKTLKRGLLFFWALWMTVVFLTNLFDFLKVQGVLPGSWSFASGNYGFMEEVTAVHQTPPALVLVLFLGVIVWEAAAAVLLWRAFMLFQGVLRGMDAVYAAFAVSLALWAAFMLADEVFISYGVEGTHMAIFTAQIATLLAIRLLPYEAAQAEQL